MTVAKFIQMVLPWITSSTRLVLIGMIMWLIYMNIAWVEVSDTYNAVLLTIVWFFFWQRSGELQSFVEDELLDTTIPNELWWNLQD